MADWNLQERKLRTDNNNGWLVNETYALRFYHFSGYNYKTPDVICKYAFRYDFASRPDLKELFYDYNHLLYTNNIEGISKLPVLYYPELHAKNKTRNNLFHRLK